MGSTRSGSLTPQATTTKCRQLHQPTVARVVLWHALETEEGETIGRSAGVRAGKMGIKRRSRPMAGRSSARIVFDLGTSTTASPVGKTHDKPSLHAGVRDRATRQPFGQDRRGNLEVARKVRALKLSCSRKATEGGVGAPLKLPVSLEHVADPASEKLGGRGG